MPSCALTSSAERLALIGRAQIVPREKLCQAGPLRGGHVLEVATAIDYLPKIFALYPLQRTAYRQQAIQRLVLHVVRNAASLALITTHQVIGRELDLCFAHA